MFLCKRATFRTLLLVALLFGSSSPGLAQTQPASLAQHVTEQLAKLRSRGVRKKGAPRLRIAVVPFVRQDREVTALGTELARQLGADIVAALPDVGLMTNAELESALDGEGLHPSVLNDEYVARWFGNHAKLDCVIAGRFSPKGAVIEVVISSVPSRKEAKILRRTATITAGGAARQWVAQDQVVKPQSLVPRAGSGGISSPICESCPAPKYTEEARQAAFVTGTVQLSFAVTPEGRASQIRILRGLEYGLTQAAIEAVRKWKFQPAKGPDGKPVTAWTTLEINFRLDYPRIN